MPEAITLSLLWLVLGLLLGLLTYKAQQTLRIFQIVALAIVLALFSGWIGAMLLGTFFATAFVFCATIAGLTFTLVIIKRQQKRAASLSIHERI